MPTSKVIGSNQKSILWKTMTIKNCLSSLKIETQNQSKLQKVLKTESKMHRNTGEQVTFWKVGMNTGTHAFPIRTLKSPDGVNWPTTPLGVVAPLSNALTASIALMCPWRTKQKAAIRNWKIWYRAMTPNCQFKTWSSISILNLPQGMPPYFPATPFLWQGRGCSWNQQLLPPVCPQ